MELKQRVQELITSRQYVPSSIEELCGMLGDGVNAEDVSRAVGELEKAGECCLTKRGRVASAESAGLLRGRFRSNAKGFGFFIPEEAFAARTGGDLYISSDRTLDAVDGDIVQAIMISGARPGGKGGEGKIVRILERSMKTLVGTLRELQADGGLIRYVKPDDRHIPFIVKVDSSADTVACGSKVEVEITAFPQNRSDAQGSITTVFGDSESREANYAAILHESGLRTEFPAAVLEEAERVSQLPLSAEERRDLRGKVIFTVDSASAKDLDDAISIEKTGSGYLLGVHIADVSQYVRPGTALDGEAQLRGTSVYFTDKVVPMLPEALSNGCCSLNAGTDKYTLSALMTIDEEGEITHCDLCESIIRSSVRGVYTEVNDLIERGAESEFCAKYAPVLESGTLSAAQELYAVLCKKSARRGMMELETTDAKIILDETGMPVDIVRVERGISECMIEQFMLCANEAVATWLFEQDMPCIYRVHEKPDPEKIKSFTAFAYNLGLDVSGLKSKEVHSKALCGILEQCRDTPLATTVSYVLLRSMAKAKYSAVCAPHFGLAIEKYCHFTSPIRRYPDLGVHRIVKMVLRGEMTGEMLGEMNVFADEAATFSSECEGKAVSAERSIDDLYKTLYMSGFVGHEFEGVISSVNPFGLFVELPNTCEGFIPIAELNGYFTYNEQSMTLSCGRTVYSLGKPVKVVIHSADIVARRVEMRIRPGATEAQGPLVIPGNARIPVRPMRRSSPKAPSRKGGRR